MLMPGSWKQRKEIRKKIKAKIAYIATHVEDMVMIRILVKDDLTAKSGGVKVGRTVHLTEKELQRKR